MANLTLFRISTKFLNDCNSDGIQNVVTLKDRKRMIKKIRERPFSTFKNFVLIFFLCKNMSTKNQKQRKPQWRCVKLQKITKSAFFFCNWQPHYWRGFQKSVTKVVFFSVIGKPLSVLGFWRKITELQKKVFALLYMVFFLFFLFSKTGIYK